MFANEMLINTLLKALDSFFTKVQATDVFPVFDMYKMLGNEAALDTCKQVCTHSVQSKIPTDVFIGADRDAADGGGIRVRLLARGVPGQRAGSAADGVSERVRAGGGGGAHEVGAGAAGGGARRGGIRRETET